MKPEKANSWLSLNRCRCWSRLAATGRWLSWVDNRGNIADLRRVGKSGSALPTRAAEDSAGDEPGRDPAPARGREQPQGARAAQSRLWLRPARRRGHDRKSPRKV